MRAICATETSSDSTVERSEARRQCASSKKLGGPGVSLIPAICYDGPIAISVKEGSVKRWNFEKFLKYKVVRGIPLFLASPIIPNSLLTDGSWFEASFYECISSSKECSRLGQLPNSSRRTCGKAL